MVSKIGILGGTFNPPHKGHIVLAQEIRRKLNLDKIFFVPTNIPPHKQGEDAGADHRLNMVKLSAATDDCFCVMDIEIKRGGVSYTIDTVDQLKQAYPAVDFYLIVGSDLANSFSSWQGFNQLRKSVQIVVAQRQICPLKDKDDFLVVDITQVDISSSQIRDMYRRGIPIEDWVGKKVADYIEKHKLYKSLNRRA